MATSGTSSSTGSPCGACKFLRRKCAADCIFAPYFCSEQGPARFAAIHKVFGASNVSKLLLHVPVADRCEAVVTIAYEAQARIRDPVYGCVAHIFALQQQVAMLQAQLMQVKAQLAQNLADSSNNNNHNNNNQWQEINNVGSYPTYNPNTGAYINPISPQSSLESSVDHSNNDNGLMTINRAHHHHHLHLHHHHHHHLHQDNYMQSSRSSEEVLAYQSCATKKRSHHSNGATTTDLGELQALALRMMRN